MTARGAHPLRRAAPFRLGAAPGWALLLVVSCALLTASLVAPTLFTRAATDAALRSGLDAVEADAFTNASGDARATWGGVLPPTSERRVLAALDGLPGWGRPQLTGSGTAQRRGIDSIAAANGHRQLSTLWYRQGAVEKLGATPSTQGVWLARDVARKLGVEAGDPVQLAIESVSFSALDRRVDTRVAGVYRRLRGSAIPKALGDDPTLARRDLPWDPDRPGLGTPLAIADHDTFERLAVAVGEQPLWTADLTLAAHPTPTRARRAARALQAMADSAFDDSTDLASALSAAKPAPTRLQLTSGLPDIVVGADATAEATREQAGPFAAAGVALSVLVVCAAAVLLGRTRLRERDLMSGLGMHPAGVAWLAALELVLPAALAAALGAAVAWLVIDAAGPPGRLGAVDSTVVVRAGLSALLAVLLGAGCAGAAAWLADRRAAGSRLGAVRRRVPWEAVLLAATALTGVALVSTEVGARQSNPLAVLFPLLLAASVSLLVLRGLAWVVRRWPRATPGSPRWLAFGRARAAGAETAAVTLALAVGLSMFGYALAVHRGVAQGAQDKVAALVGSRTQVDVGDVLARKKKDRMPHNPVRRSTVVYRQQATLPPDFGSQPLLVVNSRTFGRAVDWGASGVLDEGRRLLPQLRRRTGQQVPVLLAGDTDLRAGDRGILSVYSDWSAPFRVVGVLPAFPGSAQQTGSVTIVADVTRLMKFVPNDFDPRNLRKPGTEPAAGAFETWIWSMRSSGAVARDLHRAHIAPVGWVTRSSATNQAELRAASWSSGYVVALGICAVLLVAAAALVLAVRLADRDAVSDVLLRRMSFSAANLAGARTWEVATAVGGALLAAGLAVTAMTAAPSSVETAARIPPLTRPIPGVPDAGLLAAAAVLLVTAAGAIAARRARGRVVAEVLRGDG